MRFIAALLLCLAGGVAAAGAQAVSHDAADRQSSEPRSAKSAAPVAIEQAAKPTEQATTPTDEQPATAPADAPAGKTAEPTAADQAEAQAASPPANEPNAPAAEQAKKPDAQSEPVDQTASIPREQPIAKAAEQPAASPADQTAAKPVGQTIISAEKAAAPSPDARAKQPVQHAAPHPVDEPAYYPVEDPPAQPIEQAEAEACPGHPDALGTSRVITLSPTQYSLIGTIQYRRTLPLKDHEVVLTFDDGPIPPYTNSILDTLAANCVKATYFLVGEMAHAHPYLVRRIYNEGHTIGTHTQHHPMAIQRLSMHRVASEVEGGIASVDYALGNDQAVSPFFRIPGLGRTNAIEHFLEKKGLITWSADVDTNDWWRGTTPGQLVRRTMRRLNAKGRGIILMHDIHPSTARALPALLKALKSGGYHVVQVVATGERPKSLPQVAATALEKEAWPRVLHAQAEKGSSGISALPHRIKATIARPAHRHYRKIRHTKAAAIHYFGAAREAIIRSY